MEPNRRPCAALKTHADAGVAVIGGSQRGGEGTAYLATRPHAAYRLEILSADEALDAYSPKRVW